MKEQFKDKVVRIVIADDHTIVRDGLKSLVQSQTGMTVVGEAEDVESTVDQVSKLKPDILLLDLGMPGGGMTALGKIKSVSPSTKVLVLTMHEDAAYVRAVFANGGSGYLIKKAAHTELISAIGVVARGKKYIHPALAASLLPHEQAPANVPALTEREIAVLRLLAAGHTYQEIADRLFLSVKTVESYRSRILVKLNLRTRSELVRYALTTGILLDGQDTF